LKREERRLSSDLDQRIHFGDFEAVLSSGKLFRNGVRVKIEPQPFRVLQMLLERPGKIVFREELRERIWGESTFVEFDQGLNYCVRQIRRALCDSSAQPKYIETLPKQGYRFIASIGQKSTPAAEPVNSIQPEEVVVSKGPEADHSEADRPSSPLLGRRKLIWSAGIGLAVVASGWLTTRSIRRSSVRPVRLGIQLPEGAAAADPGRLLGPPVVAPNGDSLVVTLQTPTGAYLYVRPLDADRLIRMEGTEGASFPFWSPDGQKIAFFAEDKLKYVPAQGGGATVLCAAPQSRGGAWSRRGVILFSTVRAARNLQEISQIAVSGGNPTPLTHLDLKAGENSHRYPQFLPDGNQFLYFSRSDNLDVRGIYLSSIDQQNRRVRLSVADGLFAVGSNGSAGSTYLFSQQAGKLVAQKLDTKRGELSGNYQVVMEHPASFSVSNSGILAARTEEQELSRLLWRDRSGEEIGRPGPAGDYWCISLSRDDRFMAAVRHNFLNGEFTGWVSSTTQGYFEPLSPSRHIENLFWLGGSTTVCFMDFRKKCLLCRDVLLRGEERAVLSLGEGVEVQDISPDGKYAAAQLLKTRTDPQVAWSALPVRGENAGEWHTIGAYGSWELHPTFSPDGKWLAFGSHESGGPQIYVTDFPGAKSRLRISKDGGYSPRWRSDGRELFYLSAEGNLMSIETTSGERWDEQKPRKLFAANTRLAKNAGRLYDASSDGERFVVIEGGTQMSETRIEILMNWPSLLPE
jgi:eukaryotic-like serine/threonine-protein kinase